MGDENKTENKKNSHKKSKGKKLRQMGDEKKTKQ